MQIVTDLASTPQGLAVLAASIGAAAALAAQILAGALAFAREFAMERLRFRRRSKLAAIYCASILNDFLSECVELEKNWKIEVNPNDVMDISFPTASPNIVLREEVEWDCLKSDIVSWMFLLKAEAKKVDVAMGLSNRKPPDYDDVDRKRKDAFSSLAIHAQYVLTRLHREYDIPRPDIWNESM